MARKFEFRDHKTKLDIAGEEFYIDVTDTNLLDRVLEFGKKAQEVRTSNSEEGYVEDLKRSMVFLQESIDSILGEGASNRIFKDRKVSFFDLLDVMAYIKDALLEGREQKFNQYIPNRAQRRAKK